MILLNNFSKLFNITINQNYHYYYSNIMIQSWKPIPYLQYLQNLLQIDLIILELRSGWKPSFLLLKKKKNTRFVPGSIRILCSDQNIRIETEVGSTGYGPKLYASCRHVDNKIGISWTKIKIAPDLNGFRSLVINY